jgi:hypothetical protein
MATMSALTSAEGLSSRGKVSTTSFPQDSARWAITPSSRPTAQKIVEPSATYLIWISGKGQCELGNQVKQREGKWMSEGISDIDASKQGGERSWVAWKGSRCLRDFQRNQEGHVLLKDIGTVPIRRKSQYKRQAEEQIRETGIPDVNMETGGRVPTAKRTEAGPTFGSTSSGRSQGRLTARTRQRH